MKPDEIHCQLCDVYGENAMSSSVVRGWRQLLFNEGHKNVRDDLWSGRLSVVKEDLVRAFEEKIRENSSPLHHFPCISSNFTVNSSRNYV